MTLTGTITAILNSESGQGKNGEWSKQVFVIETIGDYPKKVAFTAWNAGVETLSKMRSGQQVTVSFNPESREYNGKWYTDLKSWKIEIGSKSQETSNTRNEPAPDEKDDLPF